MTSRVSIGVFPDFCKKKIENNFFLPPGGARELKLRPFDSESKTTSDCSNSLFSKKITLNSYFSFYQLLKIIKTSSCCGGSLIEDGSGLLCCKDMPYSMAAHKCCGDGRIVSNTEKC